MTHSFADCLVVVLHNEGGYVDDPRDPGGITNLGVTAATWGTWTKQPVNEAIMRALTPAQVTPLYQARYWNVVAADQLPDGLNLCVFDFAVNAGATRAAKMLQGVVGTAQDGQIGPATLAAVAAHDAADLVRFYSNARESYYRGLATFADFGTGWINRCNYVEGIALSWLN